MNDKGLSERNLMRLFESFDGEISMSDFTPLELEELLRENANDAAAAKRKYFEFYNDVKSPSLKRQDW